MVTILTALILVGIAWLCIKLVGFGLRLVGFLLAALCVPVLLVFGFVAWPLTVLLVGGFLVYKGAQHAL